jgi:hypothetical protein
LHRFFHGYFIVLNDFLGSHAAEHRTGNSGAVAFFAFIGFTEERLFVLGIFIAVSDDTVQALLPLLVYLVHGEVPPEEYGLCDVEEEIKRDVESVDQLAALQDDEGDEAADRDDGV